MANTAELRTDLNAAMDAFVDLIERQALETSLPVVGTELQALTDQATAPVRQAIAIVRTVMEAEPPDVTAQDLVDAINAEFARLYDAASGAIAPVVATVDAARADKILLAYTEAGQFAPDPITLDADYELGVLGLQAGGSLDLTADYAYAAQLEIDLAAETAAFADNGLADLELDVKGAIDFGALAQLGFLDVALTDNRDAAAPEIDLSFSVDAVDRRANLSGSIVLDADLTTGSASGVLPRLSANPYFETTFAVDVSGEVETTGTVDVELRDVGIEYDALLDFLDDSVGQALGYLLPYPIGTIVNLLDDPLPVLSDLSPAGDVTLLSIIDALSDPGSETFETALDVLEAFALLAELETQIETFVAAGSIPIGTLDFPTAAAEQLIGFGTDVDLDSLIALATSSGGSDPLAALGGVGATIRELGDLKGSEFVVPLLSDPLATASKLLLNAIGGEPVTLIEADLPALDLNLRYDQDFQFGPFTFSIGGQLGLLVDTGFGFDTAGFAPGSISFLDGFYLTTSGPDEAPLSLSATLTASAGVGIVIASLSIEGGIRGDLDLFFVGDEDGRTRLSEFSGPNIFDRLEGAITAGLAIVAEIGVGFFSYEKRLDLAEVTLIDFNVDLGGSGSNFFKGPPLRRPRSRGGRHRGAFAECRPRFGAAHVARGAGYGRSRRKGAGRDLPGYRHPDRCRRAGWRDRGDRVRRL